MELGKHRPHLKKYEHISRYVYRNHQRYYVVALGKILGKFDTPAEAIRYRDKLIREKKIIPQRRGRKRENEEDRYIQKARNGKYTIQKCVNGKIQHYATCNTIEEAREERNILEQIGWNWENIDLV